MNKSSKITSNLPPIEHYSSISNNINNNSEIYKIITKNKEKYCYLSRVFQQPEIKNISNLILQTIDIYILHYFFNYLVSSFLKQEEKDFPLPVISLNNNKDPNDMLFLFNKINEYFYHTIHNYYIINQQENDCKSIFNILLLLFIYYNRKMP